MTSTSQNKENWYRFKVITLLNLYYLFFFWRGGRNCETGNWQENTFKNLKSTVNSQKTLPRKDWRQVFWVCPVSPAVECTSLKVARGVYIETPRRFCSAWRHQALPTLLFFKDGNMRQLPEVSFHPKIQWDLTNGPRSVSCDRALRYSGFFRGLFSRSDWRCLGSILGVRATTMERLKNCSVGVCEISF